MRLVSGPVHNDDRVEATFKIDTKNGAKEVKIGLSGSLIAVLGLDNEDLVKRAILELAHRLIRKMVKENNLSDHIFSIYELPEHHNGGFKAYVKLRDSIT